MMDDDLDKVVKELEEAVAELFEPVTKAILALLDVLTEIMKDTEDEDES
jgi:hypothetical protein